VIYAPVCRLRNQAADTELQVVLRCDVDAHPPNVTYFWYHNGKPLSSVVVDTLHFRNDNAAAVFIPRGSPIFSFDETRNRDDISANKVNFKAAVQNRLSEGDAGSFGCEAKNLAGLGERCVIKVSGPVAYAIAETDYTYLMFGVGAVVAIFGAILLGIVACRSSS
jgi:hypothetical protein